MPLAEDPMNDAHTRLAQARFEKELTDGEEAFGIETVIYLGFGLILISLVSFLIMFVTTLAVIIFPVILAFAANQRKNLLLTAAFIAVVLWGSIAIVLVTLLVMDVASWSGIQSFWTKVFAFSSGGKTGIGFAAWAAGEGSDWVFMTYRQVGLALIGIPLITAIIANFEDAEIAVQRSLSDIGLLFNGPRKYDHVREIAFGRELQPINITPERKRPQKIDFGEAEYSTAIENYSPKSKSAPPAVVDFDLGSEPDIEKRIREVRTQTEQNATLRPKAKRAHSESYTFKRSKKERVSDLCQKLYQWNPNPDRISELTFFIQGWKELTQSQAKEYLEEALLYDEKYYNNGSRTRILALIDIIENTTTLDQVWLDTKSMA